MSGASINYIPLPFNDADSPWIWQNVSTWVLRSNEKFTLQSIGPINVKTRRKIENGEGLALVASTIMDTATVAGVIGMLSFNGRMLLLNR